MEKSERVSILTMQYLFNDSCIALLLGSVIDKAAIQWTIVSLYCRYYETCSPWPLWHMPGEGSEERAAARAEPALVCRVSRVNSLGFGVSVWWLLL